MIPRNSNLDPAPPEFPPHSRVPRWLLFVAVLTMLSVMGTGYISLRVVQRIRQFKRLAAEIQRGYQALDADFPFAAPLSPSAPDPTRLQAYLEARTSFARSVAPPVEARARELLAGGESASITDVAQLFGDFYEFLDHGTDAHLTALRAEQMGASEFFWIHGYVMHTLLEAPEADVRRRDIEATLQALERGAAPLAAPTRRFQAAEFRQELHHRYAGYPDLGAQALGGYEIQGQAMACLDIIGATPRLHRGLGLTVLPPDEAPGVRPAAQTAFLPSAQVDVHGFPPPNRQ